MLIITDVVLQLMIKVWFLLMTSYNGNKLNMDESNFRTQDRENLHQTSVYHTLGHDTENRQNLQTQTLVLPYSERNNTVQASSRQNNHQESEEPSQRSAHFREGNDVDHRFSSEGSESADKDDDKEEVKVCSIQLPIS